LGILYAWSVIKAGIPDSWKWSNADKALPYAVSCLVFALTMVPAGRLQDRLGPRWICLLGGVFAGLGCIIAGLSGSSLMGFVIGFGVFTGIGIGFGYSAMTPAAIKWFPPQKTGLIAGIVVAGFGLASVYIAPLSNWLLDHYATQSPAGIVEKGVSTTMIILGGATIIIVGILAQFVRNPPSSSPSVKPSASDTAPKKDVSWQEMIRSGQFWLLYIMYFCGAAAGLMFISIAQDLGKKSLGSMAFLAVVVLSVGNAGGRVLAGVLSDGLGRQRVLRLAFSSQAIIVAVLGHLVSSGSTFWPIILIVIFFLGMNYGANLSIFPAASKDYFGLKNFGLNYGLLFTAWGAAGLIMPWVNGLIKDSGKPKLSYFIIIGMMIVSALLTGVSHRLAERGKRAVGRELEGLTAPIVNIKK
jgi:MFS family permease